MNRDIAIGVVIGILTIVVMVLGAAWLDQHYHPEYYAQSMEQR